MCTTSRRGKPPLPFFKNKKRALILEKKAQIVSIFGLNFPFKIKFWKCLGEKTPKCFPVGPFFLVFLTNCLSVYCSSTKPPQPWKFSSCVPALRQCFFCKRLHLKYLTVVWICLCLDNCSVICTVTLHYVLHQTHLKFRHIHNSVYSDICRHIQAYSALLHHIHGYWGIMRHIQTYLDIQHPV